MVVAKLVDIASVEPIFEGLDSNVIRVGGPCMGHNIKMINQLIVGLGIEAVAEGLILAEKAGIDPRGVEQTLKAGFPDSNHHMLEISSQGGNLQE